MYRYKVLMIIFSKRFTVVVFILSARTQIIIQEKTFLCLYGNVFFFYYFKNTGEEFEPSNPFVYYLIKT